MTANPNPTINQNGLFWLFATLVICVNFLLVQQFPGFGQGVVPEWPVAVDLLLMLPLLYLFLMRARGKSAWLGAAAVLGVGILAGSVILPKESKVLWTSLEQLRFVALALVVLLQGFLISVVVREVMRGGHFGNLEILLDAALVKRFGADGVAKLLRLEARMWLYALVPKPVRTPFPGEAHFSVHLQGQNASNQVAFLIIMLVEVPIAHFLIYWLSPWVAALVTALTMYGWLFMLAEYRATLYRPITLEPDSLHVRYGILSDVVIPLSNIVGVQSHRGAIHRAPGRMRFYGMGEANVRMELSAGSVLPGFFGPSKVSEVFLGIDQPEVFMKALTAALEK